MFSKIVRRTHMYLALFLAPWMLMYALSTMAMNHREFFLERYGGTPVAWEKETEQVYNGTFADGDEPKMMAVQILKDLDMDGTYSVNRPSKDGPVTIFRAHPVSPRRITFTPADGKLLVEKQILRMSPFLERMHRRRGYQHDYALEDAWGFTVDFTIVAMIFWVASGLWMWWEMRRTRFWGAVFGAAGLGLFVFFLVTI